MTAPALSLFFQQLYAAAPPSIESIVLVSDNAGAIPEEISRSSQWISPHRFSRSSSRWDSTPIVGGQDIMASDEISPSSSDDSINDSTKRASSPPMVCATNAAPRRPQRRNSLPMMEDKLMEDKLTPSLRGLQCVELEMTAVQDKQPGGLSPLRPLQPPRQMKGSPPDRPRRRVSPPPAA
jgi:hypothetical protein